MNTLSLSLSLSLSLMYTNNNIYLHTFVYRIFWYIMPPVNKQRKNNSSLAEKYPNQTTQAHAPLIGLVYIPAPKPG